MLKKILYNDYINLIFRIIPGFIFIYAGIGKIADPALFAKEIMNYNMLPLSIINIMALTLPWIELICGILLIAGVLIRANSIIISGLLIVFIIAVGSAMSRGLDINCGCFSSMHADTVGWKKIFENLGQLFCTTFLFFVPNGKFTLENLILLDNTKTNEISC